jgi:FKBP-type peptidyl-prolyl cis-trans isomerase
MGDARSHGRGWFEGWLVAVAPLVLLLHSGCGASAPSARATRGTSATAGTALSNRTSVDTDGEASSDAASERPCTSWDPAADPTRAPADVAAPPETSRRGADGLRFCILRQGTGRTRPTREQRVLVHYSGWTTDGVMFDSTHARGEPASFAVGEVIRGWTDALTHMTVGQVRRVWVPEELAYRGAAGMPAGMLVFDIELIAIQ